MPGEHLLVIDDSPTLLKLVEIALTKAGYRVDTAADGNAGLALVREKSTVPDLILLDGMMPGSDPAEICRRLAGDTTLARVPVVVMSAKSDDLAARFAKAPNVVDYISKPFSPEALQAVVSHAVEARTGRGNGAAAETRGGSSTDPLFASGHALSGDLAVIAVAEVLALLGEQGQTGSLRAVNTKSGARVEIFFRGGHIDLAVAMGLPDDLRIGRFAAAAGGITAEALERVVEERGRAEARPPLFGADLVARGLIGAAELKQALGRQTSELAYEVLGWPEGHFEFSRAAASELPETAREAALGIGVDRLLLEGFRRVDEWRVIQREIGSMDEVFVRNDDKIADLPRGTFTRDELAVLELVNGRHTVRELVRTARLGSFDVSKVLFRLLRAKLVRRRIPPTVA
jgi:CheY-like chemotaxis protein